MSATQILETTAAKHGCTVKQLTGPARVHSIAVARHEAILWLRVLTSMTWMQIAALMGGRDHGTCIAGADAALRRMKARGHA